MIPTATLPDGTPVAALGQGTWRMGEGRHPRTAEAAALRQGIELGMTLLDTAEMYGQGGAEEVVADAISGQRDRVFVVSKVYPQNATKRRMQAACEASLKRLRIDALDLYLLHWRGNASLAETVDAFEALRSAGKIARWGVSNLDTAELAELKPGCATNQVLYNLEARGPEFDLLPWCEAHVMPVMAYSPVGQGGALLRHPALAAVAERHGATPAQIAIAWTLRRPGVISIPKASDPAHVAENAAAADMRLTEADVSELDAAFPPPRRKARLETL